MLKQKEVLQMLKEKLILKQKEVLQLLRKQQGNDEI